MSTMKKRIPMFLLAIAMMVAMALPSFAATFQSNTARSIPTNYPYFLGCWNGGRDSNGDMHVLTGTGVNNITRTAVMGESGSWVFLVSPHNSTNYYMRNSKTSEVVNMYRVLQNGTYYNCQGYWYDNNTQGRDQRIVIDNSKIRLAAPLVGGTWYLQADRSSVSDSDVIFYTDGNRKQAQWYIGDAAYN